MGVSAAILVVAAYGVTRNQERKVNKAQRKQEDVERKIQATKRARERRRAIAERRLLQGQIENQVGLTGQAGSSATIASAGAVQSGTSSNLRITNTNETLGNDLFTAQRGVADAGRLSFFEGLTVQAGQSVSGGVFGAIGNKVGTTAANSIF